MCGQILLIHLFLDSSSLLMTSLSQIGLEELVPISETGKRVVTRAGVPVAVMLVLELNSVVVAVLVSNLEVYLAGRIVVTTTWPASEDDNNNKV